MFASLKTYGDRTSTLEASPSLGHFILCHLQWSGQQYHILILATLQMRDCEEKIKLRDVRHGRAAHRKESSKQMQ